MKIVIDIPEEDYLKLIKTDENGEKEIPFSLLMSLWDCVEYNCTPLPKNHGRLIDADVLKTSFPCGESVRTECVRATIDYAPTIIEADKAESEKAENDKRPIY